ncbi:MAG: 50S ribosomal protein L17, partial [Candidatus Zixiibacteriota bacterium]
MRHQKKTKKLNRPKSHRESMLANLATSLFERRTIETTHARAVELRRLADRLITIAKADNLAARREVARTIRNKAVHKKLFVEIVPNLKDRSSGYTRVIKKFVRRGDAAVIS